ncbi:hypothetical protein BH23VER1_BH23VER1_07020 [soil metagenome]
MAEDSQQRFRPRIIARLDAPRPELRVGDLSESSAHLTEEIEESEWEAEESRHHTRIRALVIAAGLHLLLVALAALVVVYSQPDIPPAITIESDPDAGPEARAREVIEQRAQRQRPSASSASMIPVLTSAGRSDIALPSVDDLAPLPTMDLGLGAEALLSGFGGAGVPGGAAFLGLAVPKTSHVVLLVDVSGSMRGNCGPEGLAAIKREVAKTVNSLDPQIVFNIFAFASDVDAFKDRSVPATPENKKAAIAFFEGYFLSGRGSFYQTRTEQFGQAGVDADGVPYVPISTSRFSQLREISGTTRIELGVVAAMQARPKTLFIISDGEPESRDSNGRLSHETLIDLIDREYRRLYFSPGGLQVGTISVDGQGARFLRALAEHFGGIYKSIRPARL